MKKCFEWLKNKKLRKQSISVLLTGGLLAATMVAFLLTLNSFAWFSHVEKTKTTGLMMRTKVTDSLVMVTDAADIGDQSKWNYGADWTVDPVPALLPTVRRTDTTPENTCTDLYYVTNASSISPSTGLQKSGKPDFFYARIEDDTANIDPETDQPLASPVHIYYLDFDFYIASQGSAVDRGTLVFSITSADTAGSGSVASSHKAATVEVFFPEIDATDGYQGKCTVAGALAGTGGSVTVSGVNIPDADSENWLQVKLRLYFDGELPIPDVTPAKAYVNTKEVVSDGLALGVSVSMP